MCGNCNPCGCEDNVPAVCNCNIIGADNTVVDTISSPGDIIVKSPFYDVISSDNTVGVVTTTTLTPNQTVFDLSVNAPDREIAITPGCETTGTLTEVLHVDTSGPLTYTQTGCDFMTIGFDDSSFTDELVAVQDGCPPGYLRDMITSSDPQYIDWAVIACSLQLQMKPVDLFYADLNTVNQQEYVGLSSTSGFVVLPDTNQDVNATDLSWVTQSVHGGVTTNDVTIGRDGWYTVSMGGSAVVAKGIHTLRSQVRLNSNLAGSYPILDDRFEGAWFIDEDTDNVIEYTDLTNNVSEIIEIDGATVGLKVSLGRGIRGHGFGQTRTIYLRQGDVLTFFGKYHSQVSESNTPPVKYEFAYTARGLDSLTNGVGSGVFWSVAENPLQRITD